MQRGDEGTRALHTIRSTAFPHLPQLRWVPFLSRVAGEDAGQADRNCLSGTLKETGNEIDTVQEREFCMLTRADGSVFWGYVGSGVFFFLVGITARVLLDVQVEHYFAEFRPLVEAISSVWPRLDELLPVLNSKAPGYGTRYAVICIAGLLIGFIWLVFIWIPYVLWNQEKLAFDFQPRAFGRFLLGLALMTFLAWYVLFHSEVAAMRETLSGTFVPRMFRDYRLAPVMAIPFFWLLVGDLVVYAIRMWAIVRSR
jgi:hypothetical protein